MHLALSKASLYEYAGNFDLFFFLKLYRRKVWNSLKMHILLLFEMESVDISGFSSDLFEK